MRSRQDSAQSPWDCAGRLRAGGWRGDFGQLSRHTCSDPVQPGPPGTWADGQHQCPIPSSQSRQPGGSDALQVSETLTPMSSCCWCTGCSMAQACAPGWFGITENPRGPPEASPVLPLLHGHVFIGRQTECQQALGRGRSAPAPSRSPSSSEKRREGTGRLEGVQNQTLSLAQQDCLLRS